MDRAGKAITPKEVLVRPGYLDVALIDTPSLALERARL